MRTLFPQDDITPSRAYEDSLPNYLFDLWHILFKVKGKIPEVHGAMLTLEDVININKDTVPFEVEVRIIIFLKTFRIYSF